MIILQILYLSSLDNFIIIAPYLELLKQLLPQIEI